MASSFPCITSVYRMATISGTKTDKYFEVFDNLGHEQQDVLKPKIMFKISEHAGGKSTVVHHSVDIDTARYLARLITSGRLGTKDEGKHFEEFKGGPNPKTGKGVTSPTGYVSRHILITREANEPSRPSISNRVKFIWTLTNGPGQRGDKGQVTPVQGQGDPVKCFFNLTEQEAVSMALKLEAWISQWIADHAEQYRSAHVQEYTPST